MKYIITIYIDYKERQNENTEILFHISTNFHSHKVAQRRALLLFFLQSLSLIIGSRLGSRHHSSELVGLVSLGQRHLEPVLHVHGERQLGRDGVALDDVDAVAV